MPILNFGRNETEEELSHLKLRNTEIRTCATQKQTLEQYTDTGCSLSLCLCVSVSVCLSLSLLLSLVTVLRVKNSDSTELFFHDNKLFV